MFIVGVGAGQAYGRIFLYEACFYALSGIPFVWITTRLLNEIKETKKWMLIPFSYIAYGFILYMLGDKENTILYGVIWLIICTVPIYAYEKGWRG